MFYLKNLLNIFKNLDNEDDILNIIDEFDLKYDLIKLDNNYKCKEKQQFDITKYNFKSLIRKINILKEYEEILIYKKKYNFENDVFDEIVKEKICYKIKRIFDIKTNKNFLKLLENSDYNLEPSKTIFINLIFLLILINTKDKMDKTVEKNDKIDFNLLFSIFSISYSRIKNNINIYIYLDKNLNYDKIKEIVMELKNLLCIDSNISFSITNKLYNKINYI